MSSYKNDLILRAAKGEDTPRTPVWIMRQAGRILPEYRAVRSKMGGFKELVKSPEFACEVTIQPVEILGVDAAIIFSDILVIPEAMGLSYEMEESKGPIFPVTIRSREDVEKLHIPYQDELEYVSDAIRLTVKELSGRVPLIGFAGAPFTILAYMVEGKGSKTFSQTKKFLYTQPLTAHLLLEKITESTIAYLKNQINAGAALIQIFDSWAGILSPDAYNEFGAPYIEKISDSLSPLAPVTIFAKGAWFARKKFASTSARTIGLDWNMDAEESRLIIGHDKTLQGNLDPCVLYGDFNFIRSETKKMLKAFGKRKHIANLGHGVYPDIPKDNVRCFIDTVKEFVH
jgi:uroporphyrinogen decarboxylase